MAWIVIVLGLLLVIGPLMWLRPSARDRRLAPLRQAAYQAGMRVELRRLPRYGVAPEERVSAGGQPRDITREVAAYLHPLERRLRNLPAWRVLRGADGIPVQPGWAFEIGRKPDSPHLQPALDAVAAQLAALPEDVVALECEPHAVAGYWLEGVGTTPQRVTDLAGQLAAMAAALSALDERLETDIAPGNI